MGAFPGRESSGPTVSGCGVEADGSAMRRNCVRLGGFTAPLWVQGLLF
jgi:hypothetical protein